MKKFLTSLIINIISNPVNGITIYTNTQWILLSHEKEGNSAIFNMVDST